MDNNLIVQIAISVINSGKTEPSLTESPHTTKCREVYLILTNQRNLEEPFAETCKNLLLSMHQKPSDDDVKLFIDKLNENLTERQSGKHFRSPRKKTHYCRE